MSACDVTLVVSLGTNNLSIRVCESGEKLCLLRLLNGYLIFFTRFYSPDIQSIYFISVLNCYCSIRMD
jgi:hypothetical protein